MRPVCLIQPAVSLTNSHPCLDDQQYGLGLLALHAYLSAHGVPAVGLHVPLALHHGFTLDELVGLVRQHDPLVVAIGLNWVHFSRGALELAGLLRQALPRARVVVGGQHATLFSAEIVGGYGEQLDAVIVGEAERPLLAIYQSVAETGAIDPGIPGVHVPGGAASLPQVVANLDDLPLYSYRSLRPRQRQENVAAVSTARGACPFQCAYCIEPVVGRLQGRDRLHFHSAERIAAQIAHLSREGIDRFTIQDGFFVGGDPLLIGLAEALQARSLRPAHLNLFAHPNSYGPDGLAAAAAAAQMASVDYGVETGSPAVARRAGRPMEPQQVVEAVESAVAAGVVPYTWWLCGLPGEDEAARTQTRQLLLETMRQGGVPRWVSPVILFPQTVMHRQAADYGVTPRFHTFTDYMRFSDTALAEAVHFPELITHATAAGSPENILAESRRLRRFIVDNFSLVEDFYRKQQRLTPDLAGVRRTIASSFF